MASKSTAQIIKDLKAKSSKEKAAKSVRFFKTGPGEYSEGDHFLGLSTPDLRGYVKLNSGNLLPDQLADLLQSKWHEIRLFALFCMVDHFNRGDQKEKKQIILLFFKHKKHVNNWDLVDSSAPYISGPWHFDKDRSRLDKMINAPSLWDRRIAMLSTFYYIRQHDLDDTYKYALHRLNDDQDLMHKATGWMLREAGKRNEKRLLAFIEKHGGNIPRTMLRYSIEKLPATQRKQILDSTRQKQVQHRDAE